MGVYIKNMDAPTTGLYFISVDNSNGRDKTVVTVERMLGNRDVRQIVGSFELVPVPDRIRMVYRYAVFNAIEAERINHLDGILTDRYKDGFHDGLKRALAILDELPDIEEVNT